MNEGDPIIFPSTAFKRVDAGDLGKLREDMEVSRALFWSFVNMCEKEGDEETRKMLDDFERLIGEEKATLIVSGQPVEEGISLGDARFDLKDETKHHFGIFLAPDFYLKLVPDPRGFNQDFVYQALGVLNMAVKMVSEIEQKEEHIFISRNEFIKAIMPSDLRPDSGSQESL